MFCRSNFDIFCREKHRRLGLQRLEEGNMLKGSSSVRSKNVYLFFLFVLLSVSTSADIVPQTVTGYVTESVILPCRITVSGELPTVEWSKEGLSRNITLLYRDGCETFGMKNSAFLYRTNLVLNELKDGNISQIIYNLRLSDGGRYLCRTITGREWQVHSVVVLIVGSVSEPKLTFVPTSTADGGVTLECKAECWYPEPKIMLLDDEGNELKAENPTRTLVSTECFTFTRRAKVLTPINRVTCRVHETRLNQTKNTEIYIPDHWMGSCTNTAIITGILTLMAALAFSGAAFFLRKKILVMKQKLCSSGSDYPDGDQNLDIKTKKLKSKPGGSSQQDQAPLNSRSSPNGTEEGDSHSSYNIAMEQDRSEMKGSDSGPSVATQDKPTGSQKTDGSKTASVSTSSGNPLLRRNGFQRSLSYRSNASEDAESLLDKQQSHSS